MRKRMFAPHNNNMQQYAIHSAHSYEMSAALKNKIKKNNEKAMKKNTAPCVYEQLVKSPFQHTTIVANSTHQQMQIERI